MHCDGISRCLPRGNRQKSLGFSPVNCAGEMLKGCPAGYQDLVTQHATHNGLSSVGEIRCIWSGEYQYMRRFLPFLWSGFSPRHTQQKNEDRHRRILIEKKKLKFGLVDCSTRILLGVILMDEAGGSTNGLAACKTKKIFFRRKDIGKVALGCISLGSWALL